MGGVDVRHNCGLVVAHSLNDAYSMISSLQHRGREATGFLAVGDGVIDAIKWAGPVSKFDLVDLNEIFPSTKYHTFLAHVRYATKGRKEQSQILQDAHPHTIGGTIIDRGSHIIIRNCDMAIVHNGQVNNEFFSELDTTKLKSGCDTEAILHLFYQKGWNEKDF